MLCYKHSAELLVSTTGSPHSTAALQVRMPALLQIKLTVPTRSVVDLAGSCMPGTPSLVSGAAAPALLGACFLLLACQPCALQHD